MFRINTVSSMTLRVLTLPIARKESVHVNLAVPNYKYQWFLERLRDWQPVALTFWFRYSSFGGILDPGDPGLLRPAALGGRIERFYGLRSLSVIIEPEAHIEMFRRLQDDFPRPEANRALPALQELHLEFPLGKCPEIEKAIELLLAMIPWTRLLRLSLMGNAVIEETLQAVSTSLSSLRSLRLKALTLSPVWPRRRQPLKVILRYPAMLFASAKVASIISAFLEGHPLDELLIEGFPVDRLGPRTLFPTLRKLHLHVCELLPAPSYFKFLRPADLHALARHSPNLEHLELDIGHIGNLWHSTAVPGVDVDVRIYHVLDAITKLPHLKALRLFPYYRELGHTSMFGSRLTQPLTDDAAVRLFRELRERSASLETLAISSDNLITQYCADFDAMSWELRAADEKVILTARQANHAYEQRQVWVGQRRLTTEIRRFSYQKPYISEFDGWIMQN